MPKGAVRKRAAALPNPVPAPTTAAAVQRMVGRAVAAFRRASGTTQAELAARASVAVQYVQRVEAGKQNLTIATSVKFAKPSASSRCGCSRPSSGPHLAAPFAAYTLSTPKTA